jgi:alpha-D-xyloside xylohydrolase
MPQQLAVLPTRALESQELVYATVASARVVAHGDTWVECRTTALAATRTAISSADSAMAEQFGLRDGAPLHGCCRIDVVGDTAVRVRYAPAAEVPVNATPMVVGSTPAPGSCRFIDGLALDAGINVAAWMKAARQAAPAVALETPRMRVLVGLDPFRIEVRRSDGTVIVGAGGLEKDEFCARYACGLGVSRGAGGRPIAHECFDLRPGDAVYGSGERFTRLDLSGQTIDLWQCDALGVTSNRAYKNVPFFVTTAGWGVFFNHSSAMTAWVGSRSACDLQIAAEDGFLDYWLFAGTVAEVIGQYTRVTGRAAIPPPWTFGWWQSKISYASAAETLEIARRLRAERLPADVIHLDTHWFTANWYCDLEFDRERFPDPAAYLAELRGLGFRVSLWQLPYIPEGSAFFAELLAVDGFVRNVDGSLFDQKLCFTPGFTGRVGVIDFTNPRAVSVYQCHLARLFALGAAVIKTDFGEEAPHEGVRWHAGEPHQQHNLYPLLYNRAAAEASAEATGASLVWGRSAWAGSQRYPLQWGGDNSPNWHNLVPQFTGGLSLGLCGFSFWSQDIGGFLRDTNDHLLVRWMQAGMFVSHSRIHGTGPRELYKFQPRTVAICRDLLNLRYRLLPWLLGQARIAAATGLPMMRALVLDHQDDPNTWRIADQWRFGYDLLVAPVCDAGDRRRVYLPAGSWYDWWSGKPVAGARWIEVEAPLERIPLWLAAGAVVAMGAIKQSVEERPDDALEIVCTPLDADGERITRFLCNGSEIRAAIVRIGHRHILRIDGCPVPVHPRWLGEGELDLVNA